MNCSKIKNQLADYLRDNLGPGAKTMVEEHLGSCFDCAKELSFLKTYYQNLQSLPKLEAPANFGESVRERLTQQSMFSRFTFAIPAKAPGLVGALTVIVLLLLIVYPPRFHQTPSIQPSAAGEISKSAPLALDTKEETVAPQVKFRAVAKPGLKMKKLNPLTITLLVKLPLPASALLGQGRIASSPSSSKGAELFESESKKSVADENLTESSGSGAMGEKDSAPVPLPDPITKLKEILNRVDGYLVKEKYHNETKLPEELLLQIPASNYHLFLEQLSLVGEIKQTSPEPTSATEQTVELRFEFQ